MKTYVILSNKTWHDLLCQNLKKSGKANWIRIERKEDFTKKNLVLRKSFIIF